MAPVPPGGHHHADWRAADKVPSLSGRRSWTTVIRRPRPSTGRACAADVLPEFSNSDGGRGTLYKTSRTPVAAHAVRRCFIGQMRPTEIGGGGLSPVYDFILNDEYHYIVNGRKLWTRSAACVRAAMDPRKGTDTMRAFYDGEELLLRGRASDLVGEFAIRTPADIGQCRSECDTEASRLLRTAGSPAALGRRPSGRPGDRRQIVAAALAGSLVQAPFLESATLVAELRPASGRGGLLVS